MQTNPAIEQNNKKLRYREQHSVSVMLSWWCSVPYDICREKICW